MPVIYGILAGHFSLFPISWQLFLADFFLSPRSQREHQETWCPMRPIGLHFYLGLSTIKSSWEGFPYFLDIFQRVANIQIVSKSLWPHFRRMSRHVFGHFLYTLLGRNVNNKVRIQSVAQYVPYPMLREAEYSMPRMIYYVLYHMRPDLFYAAIISLMHNTRGQHRTAVFFYHPYHVSRISSPNSLLVTAHMLHGLPLLMRDSHRPACMTQSGLN